MPRLVLLLCLAVAALSTVVFSQEPPRQSPEQQGEPRADEQAAAQPIPPTIHVTVQSPEPSAEVVEQDRQARQRELGIQETIAGYTKALVFVGVAQVVTAIVGFIVSIRAANAATKGADASQISAKAAADSAQTAKNNMFLSLRARMNIDTLTVKDFGPNMKPRFTIVFRNFGGKGAYVESYRIVARVYTSTLPPSQIIPTDDSADWLSIGSPAEAGQTHFIAGMAPDMITDAEWLALEEGSCSYIVWGVLRYQAGFGQEKRVGFARRYDPALSAGQSPVFVTIGGKAYNYAT